MNKFITSTMSGMLALVAVTLTPVGVVRVALAAPGDLDTSFGSAGIVRTTIGSGSAFARALVLQPDGNIVAAGRSESGGLGFNRFTLTRYLSTGDLDPSFGSGGIVQTQVGSGAAEALAVALQPDGNIIAGGVSTSGGQAVFTLVRYLATGDLDPSFGSGGIVQTPIALGRAVVYALALQPDGNIVAGGVSTSGGQQIFALVRYLSTGDLDPSFGSGGIVQTPIGGGNCVLSDLALQPDGNIVAGGWSARGDQQVFTLARFFPNGALDPSFGSAGIVQTSIGCGNCITFFGLTLALVLQPDGNIVAGGPSQLSIGREVFTLARFFPTGDLDPSFGSAGIVQTPVGMGDAFISALALQPDGNMIAGGSSHDSSDGSPVFTLARYLPTGDLDPSFGSAGIVQTLIGPPFVAEAYTSALALQPDGNIVAGGWSFFISGGTGRFVFTLARYGGS